MHGSQDTEDLALLLMRAFEAAKAAAHSKFSVAVSNNEDDQALSTKEGDCSRQTCRGKRERDRERLHAGGGAAGHRWQNRKRNRPSEEEGEASPSCAGKERESGDADSEPVANAAGRRSSRGSAFKTDKKSFLCGHNTPSQCADSNQKDGHRGVCVAGGEDNGRTVGQNAKPELEVDVVEGQEVGRSASPPTSSPAHDVCKKEATSASRCTGAKIAKRTSAYTCPHCGRGFLQKSGGMWKHIDACALKHGHQKMSSPDFGDALMLEESPRNAKIDQRELADCDANSALDDLDHSPASTLPAASITAKTPAGSAFTNRRDFETPATEERGDHAPALSTIAKASLLRRVSFCDETTEILLPASNALEECSYSLPTSKEDEGGGRPKFDFASEKPSAAWKSPGDACGVLFNFGSSNNEDSDESIAQADAQALLYTEIEKTATLNPKADILVIEPSTFSPIAEEKGRLPLKADGGTARAFVNLADPAGGAGPSALQREGIVRSQEYMSPRSESPPSQTVENRNLPETPSATNVDGSDVPRLGSKDRGSSESESESEMESEEDLECGEDSHSESCYSDGSESSYGVEALEMVANEVCA
jgi:hypothetical protein